MSKQTPLQKLLALVTDNRSPDDDSITTYERGKVRAFKYLEKEIKSLLPEEQQNIVDAFDAGYFKDKSFNEFLQGGNKYFTNTFTNSSDGEVK